VAKIDDAAILKRAKDLCKDAGIAWDGFAAVPGGRVLDVAGRRECLMRARQQLIKEIGEAVPERASKASQNTWSAPLWRRRVAPSHRQHRLTLRIGFAPTRLSESLN
jgi:hypothetical protein